MLDTIIEMTKANGYPPTLRELSERLGISINCVNCHREFLKKKGLLTWRKGGARTMLVTEAGNASAN